MEYLLTASPKQREVISQSCLLYETVLRGNLNETFRNLPYREDFDETQVSLIKNSLKVILPEILIDDIDGFDTFIPNDSSNLSSEVETCLLFLKMSHPIQKGDSFLVTKKEAQVLSKACDVYARTLMGQFGEAIDNLPLKQGVDYDKVWRVKVFLQSLLPEVLIHRIDGWSSSLGVGSPDLHPNSNIAVDIHQVIRHKLSWEGAVEKGIIESEDSPREWSEMMTVNYDSPFHWGTEPLCSLVKA